MRQDVVDDASAHAEIDPESAPDLAVGLGLSSGAIFDGLHVRAAEKVEAKQSVTFNGTDVRRMPPQGPTELIVL